MTDNATHIENDYLTRLIAHMRTTTPNTLLEAERQMLYAEVKTITAERDAAVASTMAAYEPDLSFRRDRIAEIEGRMAGEQTTLFPVKDSPFNAAMNYAAKYPASQEPIGAVIPCYSPDPAAPVKLTVHKARKQEDGTASPEILFEWPELTISNEAIEGQKARLEAELQEPVESLEVLTTCRAPRIAMTIERNGKTYYRFKSAGYKAIAQRLGIVPYVECEGDKAFWLTAKEYARVFIEHKKMESQREHS